MKNAILILCVLISGCFPYAYTDRGRVLQPCANIDESLKIVEHALGEGEAKGALSLWVMRDQLINASQAKKASELYMTHVKKMKSGFAIWHFSWAVANLYRMAEPEAQQQLQVAYELAQKQPERIPKLEKVAKKHINGSELIMGDAHGGGRAFARKHLVVPCNDKYIDSFEEYLSWVNRKKKTH